MAEAYQQLSENPNVKVVKREYERGLFGATEVVTLEFFGNLSKLQSAEQPVEESPTPDGVAAPALPAAPPPPKPLQLTFRSEIKHGPFLGFSGFGAASEETELVLDSDMAKEVAKVLGDKKPVQIHTDYGFGGGGVTKITVPAFTSTQPSKDGQGSTTVVWEGLTMTLDFAKSMKSYKAQLDMPKIDVKTSQGLHVVFAGLHMDADQKRLFDDVPMLYIGNAKLTAGEFSVSSEKEAKSSMVAKRIVYEVNAPVQGDFIDIAAKVGAEELKYGEQSFGPAHYDFSLNRLHARSTADLYRMWVKLYSDPAALAKAEGKGDVFAEFNKSLNELLRHEPEIRIDRLSATTKDGEARLTIRARLKGATVEDLAMPMGLLARLEAGGDVAVPEALLAQFAGSEGEGASAGVAQQLAELEAQGFVVREGGVVKSKAEFAGGQLTVNGKPFMPGMGAPQQ